MNEDGVSSAGYTYIKKYLKESEKILVAERGGQTFEKCVQKLEVRLFVFCIPNPTAQIAPLNELDSSFLIMGLCFDTPLF